MAGIDREAFVPIPSEKYSDTVDRMASGTAQMPPYPHDADLERLTKRIWCQTAENYWHDIAVDRWKADQEALLPGRKHLRDRQKPSEKTGKQTRIHDEALIFRNGETTVAMTVPDDHSVHYAPADQVKLPDERNTDLGGDPHVRRFADTLRLVTESYTREVELQELFEAWVQDATLFNLGVLKCTWRIDYEQADAVDGAARDMQDNAARLESIMRDHALGRLTDDRDLLIEASQLMQQLGGDTSELEIWSGLEMRVVPRWAFRFDENVRDITRIYRAEWMSDDVLLTRRAIKSRFPYRALEVSEGGEAIRWEGIHPSHLDGVCVYEEDHLGVPVLLDTETLKHRRDEYESTSRTADDELILVRTVYHRTDGVIYTLIDGLDYPVRRVIPTRAPEQWYPYLCFSPNRFPEDPCGVSDTELQRHIVDRIHKKATDEEKARKNSLGRLFYSKNDLDEEDIRTIKKSEPGGVYGLNTKSGQRIPDVVSMLAQPYSPEAFNRIEDLQTLRQMAVISEQTQGVTGRANFASEVLAAQQGTAISVSHRQDKYRRAIHRAYRMIHELLLLYVPPDMAQQIAGPHALWPEVMSDADARRVLADVKELAMQRALMQILPAIQQDLQQTAQTGVPFDAQAYLPAMQEAAETIGTQILQERYGHGEILTREALYRRLKIQVTISVNGLVDAQQRIANGTRLLEIAAASGALVDGRPFVKQAAKQMRMEDDIDGTIRMDPNQLLAAAVQAAAANPQAVSEESVRTVMGLGQMLSNASVMSSPQAVQGVMRQAAQAPAEAGDAADPAAAEQTGTAGPG